MEEGETHRQEEGVKERTNGKGEEKVKPKAVLQGRPTTAVPKTTAKQVFHETKNPGDIESRREEMVRDSLAISEQLKQRHGLFHPVTPTCVGDPYVDPVEVSREFARGKPNFKAGKYHLNPINDGCFTPLLTSSCLPSSENQQDKSEQKKKQKNKSKTKRQEDKPAFRGGIFNSLDSKGIYAFSSTDQTMTREQVKKLLAERKLERLKEDQERIRRIREKTQALKPNIVTNPMKKGGLLGPLIFIDQTDGDGKEKSKSSNNKRNKKSSKGSEEKPFCSTTCAVSKTFSRDDEVFIHKPNCFAPVREAGQKRGNKGENKEAYQPPFKPTGTNQKALHVDFPVYLPSEGPTKSQKPAPLTLDKPSWKPSSGTQTRFVRSVMLNRVSIKQSFVSSRRPK